MRFSCGCWKCSVAAVVTLNTSTALFLLSGQDFLRAFNTERGLSALVHFEQGDAESLSFPDGSFDAVICECAFCTFPDKSRAASGFTRVLETGGRVGISDLTRAAELPKELEGLLAWIACIADAHPVEKYVDWLRTAGLTPKATEVHDEALTDMVRTIQGKLFAAE